MTAQPNHRIAVRPHTPRRRELVLTRWLPWLIIFCGVAIRIPLLSTPLTYGSDFWRQADTASIAHNMLGTHFQLLYPMINWGGNGPGYVETEFQLYPYLVARLYAHVGEQLWLGRLVSLTFMLPTCVLFFWLARRLLPPVAAIGALVFFVLSPLYLRYSVAFMPEATVLFFYVAALYLFQRWLEEQHLLVLVLAAVSTALAILVKPTSIHIGLVFALLLIQRDGVAVFRRWELWLAAVIALAPGVLWYLHARNLYLQYGNTFGLLSGGDSKFGDLRSRFSPSLYLALLQLEARWVFAYAAIPLFGMGVLLALKRRTLMLAVFGSSTVALYYVIVERYARQEWGIQYHIYAVPFAALGVGLGSAWFVQHARHASAIVIGLALTAGTLVQTGAVYQDLLSAGGSNLITCAASVQRLVPEADRVVISTTAASQDNQVPNNYQEPIIFFYAHRYGWSLPSDQHTPAALDALWKAGAGYFVIYDAALYQAHPALVAYLDAHAEQVGPGVAAGCGIYRFGSRSAAHQTVDP